MFVLTRLKSGLFWITAVLLLILGIAFVGYSIGNADGEDLVYLPLIVKPVPPPAPRVVVFEAFMRDTWGISQAASSTVNQLATEYAGQPVIFLEYDVDSSVSYSRVGRWWSAYDGNSVTLPMVMVDSGHQISNGYENFDAKYRSMVNSTLAREANANIIATGQRVGNSLRFNVEVENKSNTTLNYGNSATVWIVVYETFSSSGAGRLTNRFVRTTARTNIASLPHDGVENFVIDTPTIDGVVWDNLRAVVLVDYLPSGSPGIYDTLQAATVTSFP